MEKFVPLRTILACVTTIMLQLGCAQAQATRTWVSGTGDDVNPCSRTAPCKTFTKAVSVTAAAGEINCLDAGGFGVATIAKSLTIDCAHTEAGVLTSSASGIIVNAGVSDVVVLRGLDIMGTASALNGITFNTGAELHVEKCVIRGFVAASPDGNGLLFQPGGASKLFVSDTTMTGNGSSASGGAITIRPTGAGGARANISAARAHGNTNAIVVDGNATAGQMVVYVTGATLAGSVVNGILVDSAGGGSGPIAVMADRTSIVNSGTGVNANGPRSSVFLSGSTVFGSTAGGLVVSAGTIISYQNNTINGGNVPTDGTPNVSIPLD
jgi:hypothetical protein